MKAQLELRNVSCGYSSGEPVLCTINLSIEEGELLALVGPNGSGKTTLLKTAGGLLPPLEGEVIINGREIGSLKSRKRAEMTAILFQVKDTPWPFTVRETVAQGRFARHGWLGAQTKQDRDAIDGALERASLTGLAERPITELSGGELQRVYVARSIAQGAAFLLLDEPENNLDPKYAFTILTLIQSLVREGRGAIVSLHDLRLARRFASRVALVSPSGALAAVGTAAEVLTESALSEVFGLEPELIRTMVL